MNRLLLCTAAIVTAIAAPASAAIMVTTTTSGTDPAFDPGIPGGQALIYDFDGLSPTAGNLTGDFKIEIAPGTPGISAAPSGTPAGTHFLTVPNSTSSGSATLMLGGTYKNVSFYWGSIDDYNTLDVLDSGGGVLFSVTGSGLPVPTAANGNQTGPTSNRRVNFFSTSRDIAGFRLSSTQYAFEIDTVTGAVPEPATWAMMLGGFGLLGFSLRRRKAAKVVMA